MLTALRGSSAPLEKYSASKKGGGPKPIQYPPLGDLLAGLGERPASVVAPTGA
jgi:hypothetical protein